MSRRPHPTPQACSSVIERCVNRLKQFRRIATRYEKTARAFLSIDLLHNRHSSLSSLL